MFVVRARRSAVEGNFKGTRPVGVPIVDGGDDLGGGVGRQIEIDADREAGFDE